MDEHELYVTPNSVKFGSKIFYLSHISTVDVKTLPRRLSFSHDIYLGSMASFVVFLVAPYFIYKYSDKLPNNLYYFCAIIILVSGVFLYVGTKERTAKRLHALEILYSGSNTQFFINADKKFVEDVRAKIDDAIGGCLMGRTYIFDNSKNNVRVEGDVINSSISGRDTSAKNISIGADKQHIDGFLSELEVILNQNENHVLEALRDHFCIEARKANPDKGKLKSLWDGMLSIISDLAKLSDAFQRIFT